MHAIPLSLSLSLSVPQTEYEVSWGSLQILFYVPQKSQQSLLVIMRVLHILGHYATSWKITGSSPNKVDFISVYPILPAALWPWVRLSL
jgi:hypothetical protein